MDDYVEDEISSNAPAKISPSTTLEFNTSIHLDIKSGKSLNKPFCSRSLIISSISACPAPFKAFASYAFNKSHAAAYATLAYQTAWLKKYYCKEFICALLNNRLNKIDEITKYVIYLKDKGMKVLPPDINKSRSLFKVENDGIRFGLSALKGVVDFVKSVI